MSHLDEGTVHALLDGEIPSTELAPIQAHLADCAECQARLDAERELLGAADRLVGLIEAPAESEARAIGSPRMGNRRRWTRDLAWAASIIGAVGLGYAARDLRIGPGPVRQLDSSAANILTREAADATSPAPTVVSGSAEAPRRGGQPTLPTGSALRSPPSAAASAAATQSPGLDSRIARDEERAKPQPHPIPTPADPKVGAEVAGVGTGAAPPASFRQEVVGRLNELRTRDAQGVDRPVAAPAAVSAAKLAALPQPESVSFPEALRRLNGSLRLIPGLIPIRLEAQGGMVRVIYPVSEGELVLEQRLVEGQMVFNLFGPPGFPADSLDRLRARVRE